MGRFPAAARATEVGGPGLSLSGRITCDKPGEFLFELVQLVIHPAGELDAASFVEQLVMRRGCGNVVLDGVFHGTPLLDNFEHPRVREAVFAFQHVHNGRIRQDTEHDSNRGAKPGSGQPQNFLACATDCLQCSYGFGGCSPWGSVASRFGFTVSRISAPPGKGRQNFGRLSPRSSPLRRIRA